MKTLEEYQKQMPADVLAKHNAMTKEEALKASDDLEKESLKCTYFGIENNYHERAEYFKLLAESKK